MEEGRKPSGVQGPSWEALCVGRTRKPVLSESQVSGLISGIPRGPPEGAQAVRLRAPLLRLGPPGGS